MSVLEKIASAENLPSLPNVAVEVLRVTRDPNATVDELSQVISSDPALAARVLKMVNSSLFGLPREVASIQHAISLLGMRSVKVLALSFSLVDTVSGSGDQSFDFAGYWRRSLTTAAASRMLAREALPNYADEAFVGGLLTDVGMVAAWRCIPGEYRIVLTETTNSEKHITELERERFGTTHAVMGYQLLTQWGLPESLCQLVECHHGDELDKIDDQSSRLVNIVRSAALIADIFCQEIPAKKLAEIKQECLKFTGMTPDALETILDQLDVHVRETAKMLSLKVGETLNYSQIQSEAALHLAHLSMQAEFERSATEQKEMQARAENARLHQEKMRILEMASTDGLTGIPNRAAFDSRLTESIRKNSNAKQPLALIMLDVDHFKRFNDTHGHQAGDAVLRHVAQCIQAATQDVGFIARYGGEEFGVILSGPIARKVASVSEKIRTAIEKTHIDYNDKRLTVTASLGGVCVPPESTPIRAEQLIESADRLLYKAKANGRNRIECGLLSIATPKAVPAAAAGGKSA